MARISLCMAVNNLDVGGLERLVISLLANLPRDRFDLSLICLSGEGKLFSQVDLPQENILVLDKAPMVSRIERAKLPVQIFKIAKFLRERRVDILNVHNLAPLLYAGTAARLLPGGPRVIYTEHNQIYRANEKGRRKFREYSRVAHQIVAVSHDLERTLVDKVKVRTPVQVIHNGIDGSRFGGPKDGSIRKSLGIADDAFVFGTAVVISEQKGITFLLDAAKLVLAEEPKVNFLIAGDGPLRAPLEARSKAEGLEPQVRFLGYRSDIPQLIATYDTYVLSSLWEGLPLALLEALAHGLPVVCTSVGGNPEVIEHGVNGFVVPPRDPKALAEHLLRIYRDRDLRAKIHTASPQKFEKGFSMHAMVSQYLRLFDAEMAARAA